MVEDQNEAAAAELAERSNGGNWDDPRYYAPSHKAYWRARVTGTLSGKQMSSDLKRASKQQPEQTAVTPAEVNEFSSHCVFIRSVYVMGMRIWRDSNESERKTMEALAPSFFSDFNNVLGEFLIIAVSRITDPAVDSKGNENFTVELLQRACPREDKRHAELEALRVRMSALREKILPARNKLGAHVDREIVRAGKPLGAASWKEWDDFWQALASFVRILNEVVFGKPFEIDAGGPFGDAEMLLKSFKQSAHFESLLHGKDTTIREACIAVASRGS
jgi:hypothetical protein